MIPKLRRRRPQCNGNGEEALTSHLASDGHVLRKWTTTAAMTMTAKKRMELEEVVTARGGVTVGGEDLI